MKNLLVLLLTAGTFGSASQSLGADLNAMQTMCDGCHGSGGVSEWTEVPTIAGIDAFTHSEALYVYRDNARPCLKTEFRQGDKSRAATDMCAVAAELSDEDIEQIAEYYAGLEFKPAAQAFDATLVAAGKKLHDDACDRCHSAGGADPDDEASILAGQWLGYLEQSFADYASGERDQPAKMRDNMEGLSGDDIAALLQYYASQQ